MLASICRAVGLPLPAVPGSWTRWTDRKDLKVVNPLDSDIARVSTPTKVTPCHLEPELSAIKAKPGVHRLFNSSQIPVEIMDMMVVTAPPPKTPGAGPSADRAGFEVVALMNAKTAAANCAGTLATASGTDLRRFQAQLAPPTVRTPSEALPFAQQHCPTLCEVADFPVVTRPLCERERPSAVGISFAKA